MPAIDRNTPARGSYNHVLRRYDLACIQAQSWATYDESTMSRAIVFDGVEAQTLFLRSPAGAHRATILGWHDVTQKWNEHLEREIIRPTTEPQRKILEALAGLGDALYAKREIMAGAGIVDSEWRTAISYLEKLGLVSCSTGRKGSATNRSYRYQATAAGRKALEE